MPGFAPREPGGGTPSIYIESSTRHYGESMPRPYEFAGSIPMGIPIKHQTEEMIAPPPLPPPKYISPPECPPSGFPSQHNRDLSRGSESSYGSFEQSPEVGNWARKPSRTFDEGYHSLASTLSQQLPESAPKKRFMTHDQFQFRPSGSDYDTSLLKKLDAPRRCGLSSSTSDSVPRYGISETRQLPFLSLPIRSSSSMHVDSPSETGVLSAALPRAAAFHGFGSNEYRSPIEPTDADRSPPFRSKRTYSGSVPDDVTVSTQGSYENTDDTDFTMEDAGMDHLHIHESNARPDYHMVGQKRRASSPLGDDVPMQGLSGAGDILRRREGISRASQPRLTIPPSFSPISTSRSGSYAPSLPLTAASGTSMTSSFGRRSPGGLSPGGLSPVDAICNSPFTTPISLTHSPRSSFARVPHQRPISESRPLASPRKLTEIPKANMPRIQGFYMCECCPKKPKKFETAEELSAHAAEKQYECSFCGNRFKNKNEAERHQNSLHVRRHSWSCSALSKAGYDKAFHESTSRPGEADTCGYCGEEFPRSGTAGRIRQVTDQDWDDRSRHLQEVHKFRECNSSKKFYRADHFRQHLKHSHAGTSGKWTNMLETACMIEEEPPQPR